MENSCFDSAIMKKSVELVEEHRSYLHTIPEKAFEEYQTTAYIRKVCEEYPVEIIDIGMETGLVCWLDAGMEDTIALRTDIDAVPTEHGPHHFCGHDAHTATLLGAMHYLCTINDILCGKGKSLPHNVLFIFQPAEEGTRGARAMLDHGILNKIPMRPSRIFGIHNRPEVDCGDIIVHRGPLMSEKSVFEIKLTGGPGHGSLPHKNIDPIVAAGTLICSMQTIVSRNIDPFQPAICTINSVTGGKPDNSAPETAVLTGYIRSFSHETHKHMEERLRSLAEGIAEAYQCRCEVEITPMVPAVVNTDEMYEPAYRAAVAAVGEDHVKDSPPSLASEDFAVWGTKIPSFFYWVGSGTPGKDSAPWHDPAFCVDPHYTEVSVPLLCAAVIC